MYDYISESCVLNNNIEELHTYTYIHTYIHKIMLHVINVIGDNKIIHLTYIISYVNLS